MTLDCTPGFADALEARLAAADDFADWGLYRQKSAQITCFVPSIADHGHVHFVDGAEGGYTLAASALKARRLLKETPSGREPRGYRPDIPITHGRGRFATVAPMDATETPNLETTAAARLTPMMAQYFEIKAGNPDCLLFYRMGDFYELFFDDAEVASRALGIVLTKRGKHDGEDIRMCGVPIERADDYLNRLIALGHRVAVCEQLEDPAEAKKRGAKSVVKRDVVRLVTPGTITEERLLEPGRARLLVAVQRVRAQRRSLVLRPRRARPFDRRVLRSRRRTRRASPPRSRGSSPARSSPSQPVYDEPPFAPSRRRPPHSRDAARPRGGRRRRGRALRVCEFYGVETLDGFGAFSRAEIAAAALALAYVKRTQFERAGRRLSPPTRRARGVEPGDRPGHPRQPRADTHAQPARAKARCSRRSTSPSTPAGARLLAERLASPLTDPGAIDARLDALELPASRPRRRATR